MDQELQQALKDLENRLVKHFNERIEATELRLNERIEATELRLNERIETTETRLLTEFHKWASPMETRVQSHSAVMRALDLEMEYLRERVNKLENKS